MVAALKFFLGKDEDEPEDDSDSEEEDVNVFIFIFYFIFIESKFYYIATRDVYNLFSLAVYNTNCFITLPNLQI